VRLKGAERNMTTQDKDTLQERRMPFVRAISCDHHSRGTSFNAGR
jgi:hypothetical protein